jgi:hypothetical protein
MGGKRWLAAGAVLASLALTGCYGTTDPATNVGEDHAQLHAHGTANGGPAFTSFIYSGPADVQGPQITPTRHWPAGASGSFAENVSNLWPASHYAFQMCGGDATLPNGVCTGRLSFTTATPGGDYVIGPAFQYDRFNLIPKLFDVYSESASGAQPQGTISIPLLDDGQVPPSANPRFTGKPTCLAVHGDGAVIGAVDGQGNHLKVTLAGGGARYGYEKLGSTTPDCATITDPNLDQTGGTSIVVRDVP